MVTLTQKEFEQQKTHYRRLNLIKTDRNGSQYYEGLCPCPRCGGQGIYYIAVVNGVPKPADPDSGRCFKCGGQRVIPGKIKVITEDYAKILEGKRVAKQIKTVEEAEKKIAENKERLINKNKELGYKEVDFTFADWFNGDSNLSLGWKYYRIVHETDRACLLSLSNFLDIETWNMHETWVPKKAIIYNTKGGSK